MQIKTATVVLALLGPALAVPAPANNIERAIGRPALAGRQLPPPIPERCAELEEQCDCSRIPKDDIEGWFQCTTNWQCEWCAGLWTSEPEEPEEPKDKPQKPRTGEAPGRGRDMTWE